MARKAATIRTLLARGCLAISKGYVDEAIEIVRKNPRRMESLIECLWDEEPGVANRAADAVEQLTRESATTIQPWKSELVSLLAEAKANKLRWNLALIVTRLKLTLGEARAVEQVLAEDYLADRSSIVKTLALQGLYNLSRQHPALEPQAIEMLQIHGRGGTAAMRARSKNLLISMEKQSAAKLRALLKE